MRIGEFVALGLLVPWLLLCQAGPARLNHLPLQMGIAGACGWRLHHKSTVEAHFLNKVYSEVTTDV